ncbi:multiple epidermal growth factor-like domains protein 10 [Physella acuta]|uniref:multiple epidermal growth factor-like domains protein 10 n=1 Tax=Physella acuta TaxID=109671 RepID=UPI0027DCA02D|nr:multiple epidermal growth factor-like domains protein 10 [Physella acuta]
MIYLNECSSPTTNNCPQLCNNFVGGYSCACFHGYFYNSTTNICSDINECQQDNTRCEQLCINTEGSYRCSCTSGLLLQPDGLTCRATIPCTTKTTCSYQCATINDTETCLCSKGTTLAADGLNCDDIDLCAKATCKHGCVETQQNTSLECVCPVGQTLSNDGITCDDCIEGSWGTGCNNTCSCKMLNTDHCDQVTGSCQCKIGWGGATCEDVVIDCRVNKCSLNYKCMSTGSGYICVCDDGFSTTGNTCTACEEGYWGTECSNTCSCSVLGTSTCDRVSGTCQCKSGWSGTNCDKDVDECLQNTTNCSSHSHCNNTDGSFVCLCDDGYFNSSNTCEACVEGTWGTECSNNCSCSVLGTSTCDKVSGTCHCKSGWSGTNCDKDVDECLQNTNNCPSHSHCNNTDGSFVCLCDDGYFNSSNKCEACVEGSWGTECNKTCSCSVLGTSTYDKVSGTCQCKSGWSGTNCDKDVDECLQNTKICPSHSHCNNTEGSFDCVCDEFYFFSNNKCEACEENYYGPNCTLRCVCNTSNHEFCTKQGKEYVCSCDKGFEKKCNSCACEDIDECALSTPICEQKCTNTIGGVNCSCKDGFAISPTNSTKCHETTKHNVTITFNLDVSKLNLEDKNSDDYNKTKDEVESQMYKQLKATGVAVTEIYVQNLKKGSLIADILVLIDSIIESSPDKSLTSALQVIMTQGITINNVLSTVLNLYVGGQTVYASTCEVRQKTNPCRNNEACIVENGATVCRVIVDDDMDLKLGLGIGLPLAVLACVVTGVVVYFCKKTSGKHKIFP